MMPVHSYKVEGVLEQVRRRLRNRSLAKEISQLHVRGASKDLFRVKGNSCLRDIIQGGREVLIATPPPTVPKVERRRPSQGAAEVERRRPSQAAAAAHFSDTTPDSSYSDCYDYSYYSSESGTARGPAEAAPAAAAPAAAETARRPFVPSTCRHLPRS